MLVAIVDNAYLELFFSVVMFLCPSSFIKHLVYDRCHSLSLEYNAVLILVLALYVLFVLKNKPVTPLMQCKE